jgi:ABC-2 type transport system ATP-binding protein
VDLVADVGAARALCSYLPQSAAPIASLRLRWAIELMARIRGASRDHARERAAALIAALDLGPWSETLGSSLSGGVLRLAGFAMAAAQPGRVVILDEPTNDVDPLRRRLLWREIRRLADAGSAVLLVTHNVLEAEHAVDRLAVIDGGRVVDSGTPASLKADVQDSVRLVLALDPLAGAPDPPPFVREQSRVGRRLVMVLDEAEAPAAMAWARARLQAGEAEEYEIGATTLEDTYARLVGRPDTSPDNLEGEVA